MLFSNALRLGVVVTRAMSTLPEADVGKSEMRSFSQPGLSFLMPIPATTAERNALEELKLRAASDKAKNVFLYKLSAYSCATHEKSPIVSLPCTSRDLRLHFCRGSDGTL